ncbi:MAG: hypothetical protein LIP09_14150 [Bacteroidales bacterium]|nr:hypothetical protein [Bacteroidales bacterium]MCC8119870.1 hypothetical protein [Bacteroidales bacterium]
MICAATVIKNVSRLRESDAVWDGIAAGKMENLDSAFAYYEKMDAKRLTNPKPLVVNGWLKSIEKLFDAAKDADEYLTAHSPYYRKIKESNNN